MPYTTHQQFSPRRGLDPDARAGGTSPQSLEGYPRPASHKKGSFDCSCDYSRDWSSQWLHPDSCHLLISYSEYLRILARQCLVLVARGPVNAGDKLDKTSTRVLRRSASRTSRYQGSIAKSDTAVSLNIARRYRELYIRGRAAPLPGWQSPKRGVRQDGDSGTAPNDFMCERWHATSPLGILQTKCQSCISV